MHFRYLSYQYSIKHSQLHWFLVCLCEKAQYYSHWAILQQYYRQRAILPSESDTKAREQYYSRRAILQQYYHQRAILHQYYHQRAIQQPEISTTVKRAILVREQFYINTTVREQFYSNTTDGEQYNSWRAILQPEGNLQQYYSRRAIFYRNTTVE